MRLSKGLWLRAAEFFFLPYVTLYTYHLVLIENDDDEEVKDIQRMKTKIEKEEEKY